MRGLRAVGSTKVVGFATMMMGGALAGIGACTTNDSTNPPERDSGSSSFDSSVSVDGRTEAASSPDAAVPFDATEPGNDAGDSSSVVSDAASEGSVDAGHDAAIAVYACADPVPYNTANAPQTPIIVNLTHHALPDVAIVNHLDNSLEVYLNTGDGGILTPQVPYPTGNGSNPHEVVTADINNDGWADLCTSATGTLTVHLNAGDGTGTMLPGVSTPYGSPIGGDGLTFADLNGDHLPDFAGTVLSNTAISVRLNQTADAGPAWGPEATYHVGNEPDTIAIGDLAGNHVPDIVVGNLLSQDMTILIEQADGGFLAQPPIPVGGAMGGESAAPVLLADLNGDGATDLVVGNADVADSGLSGFMVFINKNDSTGTFLAPVSYELSTGGGVSAIYDMNGDGSLDLVGSNGAGDMAIILLNQNDPLATFGPPTFCNSGPGSYYVTAGNLNGDNKGDIVTANSNNTINVILGQ